LRRSFSLFWQTVRKLVKLETILLITK